MEIIAVGFDSETLLKRYNISGDVKYIDIEDIPNHKADILIICLDQLTELYEELYYYENYNLENNYKHFYKKVDLYEFDRLNRNKYKNYKKVYIVSIDCFFKEFNYHFKSLYTNLNFIDDFEIIDVEINDEVLNTSNIKTCNICKLKKYVDKQEDYFDSKDIMKEFNVSNRWVKRYMYDMNKLYNNIGYSYSKRKWYKIIGE